MLHEINIPWMAWMIGMDDLFGNKMYSKEAAFFAISKCT